MENMEEKENTIIESQEEQAEIEKKPSMRQIEEMVIEQAKSRAEKIKEAKQVIGEGKGILHLEKPIKSGSGDVEELPYDFMALNGLELTDALDSSPSSQQIFGITNRQALALFAAAAAKQTESLDKRDILERIGGTDAVEAVQLATLFFRASSMAGQMRITKKQ